MRDDQMPNEVRGALAQCERMITVGSKSFSLAARIFSPETRRAAFFLYGWCRYCDDQVDQEIAGDSQSGLEARLRSLQEQTRSAFAKQPQQNAVFIAFQYVMDRYSVPEHYPLELLEGMAMDVRKQRYATLEDLLHYCYRVAGTVGLMMAHVMGVSDEKALKHAADLGIGMQLTNIARDVIEDAERDRVYLPLAWLEQAGVPADDVVLPQHREKISGLARRLVEEAQKYYHSGDAGLRYLPFRCACAIAAARNVYAEIGRMVLKRGPRAWDGRTFTSKGRKLWLATRGILRVLRSAPKRIIKPWSPMDIDIVWRFSQVR
jgi:phytoene synthase